MYQTIPLFRILQVFVLQLGMGIFFLILGILILRRKKGRINVIFSGFFISTFIGVLLNVIYATLTDVNAIRVLNFWTYFFGTFAMIFLMVFNLIVYKSEKIIDSQKQLTIIIIFGVLLLLSVFIPDSIIIRKENNYVPQWSIFYVLYYVIITMAIAIIPAIFYAIKIYQKMESPEIKKKWTFYVIGVLMFYTWWLGISFINVINDPTIRLIWNIISLSLFLCAYFMYYGVGRQIREK
ncbi:MAG: hypothetical protein ACFFAO_20960 [Candidatus Hermodarchaeota archaeon]